MAEDTTGFSPLDPLGPEYGKINQPSLDVRGLSPFEGDRITQKPINFPEPKIFQALPGINLDRQQRTVRENVVGAPGAPAKKNASFEEMKNATQDYLSARIKASQSPDSFAKIYSYNAGPDSNAFYKRYMAYGQEKFDEIGFSPLRDNEALFNSRTSMWDDFNRMMTHSFIPLFTRGFVSGPKSLAKMLSGDFTSADLEDARAYEEAAAIGMSTKGGFSGFLNNTLMNFGYTAGIMSEAIVEEIGGALLAAPTGGASLFATTANNLRKIKGLGTFADTMKGVNNTLGSLKNFQFARNFWNSAKAVGTSRLGRMINPLENTMDAIGDLRKLSKTDNITGLAATYKTAGGFYRDVRNLNMAISEARLEAGMVENKRYDEDYKKLYDKFQRAPTNEEQKLLEKNAKEAGQDTFYWNAGLIYATNKITFDNITGPRGGLRNFIKKSVEEYATVGGGKFGTLGKIVYNNTTKAFDFEAKNLKTLAKSWWRDPGVKTLGKTIGYLKANFTEGFQENLQEVIARTNEKYYGQVFDSKMLQSHLYGKAVADYSRDSQSKIFGEELGAEFSAQGFETFASGFFMGMFAQPLNQAIPFLSTNYNRMFKKDEYAKYVETKMEIKDKLVEKLNKIDIGEFLKSKAFNLGIQDVINDVKRTGSKKEALDAEVESLVKSVGTMMESNTADLFIEKIRDLEQATDEEFMDIVKDIDKKDVPKYRERIRTAADKIERIQERYNYYKDKMPNPISDDLIATLDKGSQDHIDAVTLKHGWDLAVNSAVYYNEAFEDTMVRMSEIQRKFLQNTTLKKFGQNELNLLFDPAKLNKEIAMQKRELSSLEGTEDKSTDVKEQIKNKKDYIKQLENVFKSYSEFDRFYNRQDYYDSDRAQLKEKLGKEPTDEEIVAAANKAYGDQNDEKLQTKVVGGLQKSIYDYIKHVAKVNNDTAFDENLDKSFELLLDHYKLGSEGRYFVNYINLLHNPGSVFEFATRQQEWMKKMYENRKEYYDTLVKKQMAEVENNALLNELADKGIFINLEDLQNFLENGVPPKELFNNVTNQVIPEGTKEYLDAMTLLLERKQLQDLAEEEVEEEVEVPLPGRAALITPKNIGEVQEALKALNEKILAVNPDNTNTYMEVDENGKRLPETALWDRVSTMKGEFKGDNKAADRGTIIDDMLRSFIDGTVESVEDLQKIYNDHPLRTKTQPFTEGLINDLFNIFTEVKTITDTKGITLTSRIPTLWGEINGKRYAGTIDLMGIDQNGNVYVIDLKTSTQNRRDKEGKYYDTYREGDKIQQSAYAEMIRQRTGITVKNIVIFPVQVKLDGGREFASAEVNRDEAGNITMGVEIDRNIFPEVVETQPTETSTDIEAKKADIERRRREATTFTSSRRFIKGINHEVSIAKKFGLEGFDVDVSTKANTSTGFLYDNSLSEHFDTIEEAIEYANQIIQGDKEYIKKVDAELPALESTSIGAQKITKQEEKPQEILSPKISEVVGKTVYYNGKPYIVEREGVRYILNSDTTIIELAGDKNSTLESLGIDYFMGEFYKPQYDVTINNENSTTINGVQYTIKSDNKGNIIGLSPLNKPEQIIKNEKLLIAVEIERNKTNFINTNKELEDVNTEELLDQIEETDPASHQKLMNVERVYNMNWNETVEAGLSNLYSKKSLTESQRLAVDLWVTDAIINMTKVYNKTSDPIYANALDNLEIINTLLYEGYTQEPQKTGVDESTKTRVKQTPQEAERKQGKIITDAESTTIASEETQEIDYVKEIDRLENQVNSAYLHHKNMVYGSTDRNNPPTTRAYYKKEAATALKELNDLKAELEALKEEYRKSSKYPVKGQQYYALNMVLGETAEGNSTIFVNQNETVVVDSVNTQTDTVVLQKLNNPKKQEFSIEDLNKMFKLEGEPPAPAEEKTIDNMDEAKEFTSTANDLTDDFISDQEQRKAIEKSIRDAYKENPDEIISKTDDDLLNDLIC